MAANAPASQGPQPTLGLTGLTVNAMALIAPGAFLWTTFQAQAALNNGTKSTASNMWFALIASMAIAFRASHGSGIHYEQSSILSVLRPHDFTGIVYQGTIAILLLVGFESVTALGSEAKNPKRHIRQAILLSLAIQGIVMYLFEYF